MGLVKFSKLVEGIDFFFLNGSGIEFFFKLVGRIDENGIESAWDLSFLNY